ncbi:MAG: FAD-dependent oxidoreductase, partial [Pseudomonadota bacterium]
QAIHDVPMGLLAKVALQFDGERFGFLPDNWLTYWVPDEMPAEACYFLTGPFGFDVTIGFVGGSFGWDLTNEGEAAAIDFALSQFAKMAGSNARKHFVSGRVTDWGQNPLTLGAYSAVRPGRFAARAELARPVGNRLFFAGEAMSDAHAGLCGGAYSSGKRAAEHVVAALT